MNRALSSMVIGWLTVAMGCGAPISPGSTVSLSEPIVGGIAEPNHRYVVSLGGCTGTVISKHTVLTAGHCYGGLSRVTFGPTSSGGMSISVAQQVRHPMYADICDQDATYDLAVVKLAQPAPVQAAPLLRATLDNSSRYVGPSWVWVGYGRTGPGGGSGTKRATTFPIDLVGPAGPRGSLCMIPETLIYTATHGRNACNGDSGGPSFWVHGGVEYLAGVTSSGDDACVLDDTQQRSDQPYIDQFIQAQIDAFEGADPCRADGVCDETCNSNGQLGDPDCAANHCGADGICAEACVAPRDPDCEALDEDNCGDNGVCDLRCPSDPDCVRDCAAEGNCIPGCPTPDPDCSGVSIDAGMPGVEVDAARSDANAVDANAVDANAVDAGPVDAPSFDDVPRGGGSIDAVAPGSPGRIDTSASGSCACYVGASPQRASWLGWGWAAVAALAGLARARRLARASPFPPPERLGNPRRARVDHDLFERLR